jgi:blocked early in transport 1
MRQRSNNSSTNSNNSNSNSNNKSKANGSNMYRNSYNPSSLEAGRDTNANILEQQNNDRISELSDQVARLKGLTIDIGNEVREQNSLLDDMGDGFSGVSNLLGSSLKRIGVMLESGGAKHMCYLVTFVVFVMVFLYWVRIRVHLSVLYWSILLVVYVLVLARSQLSTDTDMPLSDLCRSCPSRDKVVHVDPHLIS